MNATNSRLPARTALIAGLCIVTGWALAPVARASVDTPGAVLFDFYSEPEKVFDDWSELPQDTVEMEGRAYFSSNASSFGADGVFVWAAFEFTEDSEPRAGILLLDLDISRAPLDGETPMPHSAIKAEYIEKWGDQIFFEGRVVLGDVWLVDVFFHEDDHGALEGDLALVFADPSGRYPGCRVLVRGIFVTNPSPASLRNKMGIPDTGEGGSVYVDTSCSGNLYVSDEGAEGCDCGGEDPDSGGCEGDTADGGDCSGCEGDSGGGDCSGCSGDTGGSCSGDAGGSCSGASGAGSCGAGGAATCSTQGPCLRPRRGRSAGPLKFLTRFLPELFVLGFIFWMKRKVARQSG